MSSFQVGDKVKITGPCNIGDVPFDFGTVVDVDTYPANGFSFQVKPEKITKQSEFMNPDDWVVWFSEKSLEATALA